MFTDLDLEELIDAAIAQTQASPTTDPIQKQVVMTLDQLQYFVRLAVNKLSEQKPIAFMWAESGSDTDTHEGPGDAFENICFDTETPIGDTPYQELFLGPCPAGIWPKLDTPAMVGYGRFQRGVSSQLVVEAAQRLYEREVTPGKETLRIARASENLTSFCSSMKRQPIEHNWIEP